MCACVSECVHIYTHINLAEKYYIFICTICNESQQRKRYRNRTTVFILNKF